MSPGRGRIPKVAIVPPHLRAIDTGLSTALVNITDHVTGTPFLDRALAIIALSDGPLSVVLMVLASRSWFRTR